ncbi:hypothetical protein Tco_0085163 [Tanacetum coccineum]
MASSSLLVRILHHSLCGINSLNCYLYSDCQALSMLSCDLTNPATNAHAYWPFLLAFALSFNLFDYAEFIVVFRALSNCLLYIQALLPYCPDYEDIFNWNVCDALHQDERNAGFKCIYSIRRIKEIEIIKSVGVVKPCSCRWSALVFAEPLQVQRRHEHDMESDLEFTIAEEVYIAEKEVSTAEPVSTAGA